MRHFAAPLALVLCACAAPTTPADDGERRGGIAAPATTSQQDAIAALPTPTRSPSTAIPDQFQGEWYRNPEHCGTALDDSRLRIGVDGIRYHESRGPVRAAVANGRHELALIVELSGEGETWLKTEHFRLSPDLDELTSVNGAGVPFVRYRCAPASS